MQRVQPLACAGPLFSPLNWALRSRNVEQWATTIACTYSAILKLSYLSQPARVYRGVKEVGLELPPAFLTVEEGKFAGGVEVRARPPAQLWMVSLFFRKGMLCRSM